MRRGSPDSTGLQRDWAAAEYWRQQSRREYWGPAHDCPHCGELIQHYRGPRAPLGVDTVAGSNPMQRHDCRSQWAKRA